jgi:hypothetical protein
VARSVAQLEACLWRRFWAFGLRLMIWFRLALGALGLGSHAVQFSRYLGRLVPSLSASWFLLEKVQPLSFSYPGIICSSLSVCQFARGPFLLGPSPFTLRAPNPPRKRAHSLLGVPPDFFLRTLHRQMTMMMGCSLSSCTWTFWRATAGQGSRRLSPKSSIVCGA